MIQYLIGVLFLTLFVSVAHAKQPWIGQFLYKYDAGNTYRVTVQNASDMHWICVRGDEIGAEGNEKPQRLAVNQAIYFVTWTENSGVQVTQVLDFKKMKVNSTVIDGADKFVLSGTILREK